MSHDKQHGLNSTVDHLGVSGGIENNFLALDANGLPKDSGSKSTDFAVTSHQHDSTYYTKTELQTIGGANDKIDWSHLKNIPDSVKKWLPPTDTQTTLAAIDSSSFTGGEFILVKDDGDGKAAFYYWTTSPAQWNKSGDVDWDPYSASEIKTLYESNDNTNPFTDTDVTTLANKADKVTSPTENNFVSLDSTGNIKDSGSKSSDFEVAGAVTTHQTTYDHTKLHDQNSDWYLASPAAKLLYVNKNRTDSYIADGSVTKPFKTIQEAVTTATMMTTILVAPGYYAEDILFDGQLEVVVRGTTSVVGDGTRISGKVTIQGALTKVGLIDIRIQPNDNSIALDYIDGSNCFFENLAITRGSNGTDPVVRIAGTNGGNGGPTFVQCSVFYKGNGIEIVAGSTFDAVRFVNCLYMCAMVINAETEVKIQDCSEWFSGNGIITHHAGTLKITGSSLGAIVSDANTGALIINRSSLRIWNGTTRGTINKTGSCDFFIGDLDFDLANSTINGNNLYVYSGTKYHVSKNRGHDVYGNGSQERPFSTIQHAVEVVSSKSPSMANPYSIHVEPGVYAENVILRTDGVHLHGVAGQFATRIKPTTGPALIITNATLASVSTFLTNNGWADPVAHYSDLITDTISVAKNIQVRDISLEGAGASSSYRVMILGTGTGQEFLGSELNFMRCGIIGSLFCQNANYISVQGCSWLDGGITGHNCAGIWLNDIEMASDINWNYNVTNPQPSDTGNYGPNATKCVIRGNVVLNGSAKFGGYGEDGCMIVGNVTLNDTSNFSKRYGCILGNLNIGSTTTCGLIHVVVNGTITDPGLKLTGTVLNRADGISYSNTSNFSSDPLEVKTALDKLSAAVQSLLGSPIP